MVLALKRISVAIEYCAPCEYLPQAIELSHRLLFDFQGYIKEFSLVPGTGGVFNVYMGDKLVYSNDNRETFPSVEEMRRAFRRRLKELTGEEA
ncbi:MAG: SelT/SelW/SelH family protein [Chloroflexi bacterium]|nr:SelT/SelW/SelH family protein [Chloroflexota bacterium]